MAHAFQNGQKSLFFTKSFISIFSGLCPQCATMYPMCITFLGSLGVAHWVHPVYFKVMSEIVFHFFYYTESVKFNPNLVRSDLDRPHQRKIQSLIYVFYVKIRFNKKKTRDKNRREI